MQTCRLSVKISVIYSVTFYTKISVNLTIKRFAEMENRVAVIRGRIAFSPLLAALAPDLRPVGSLV